MCVETKQLHLFVCLVLRYAITVFGGHFYSVPSAALCITYNISVGLSDTRVTRR